MLTFWLTICLKKYEREALSTFQIKHSKLKPESFHCRWSIESPFRKKVLLDPLLIQTFFCEQRKKLPTFILLLCALKWFIAFHMTVRRILSNLSSDGFSSNTYRMMVMRPHLIKLFFHVWKWWKFPSRSAFD
jgi:hypothetical protein